MANCTQNGETWAKPHSRSQTQCSSVLHMSNEFFKCFELMYFGQMLLCFLQLQIKNNLLSTSSWSNRGFVQLYMYNLQVHFCWSWSKGLSQRTLWVFLKSIYVLRAVGVTFQDMAEKLKAWRNHCKCDLGLYDVTT